MRFRHVQVLVAFGLAGACDAEPGLAESELTFREAEPDEEEGTLQQAPYRVEFDASAYGGVYEAELDFEAYGPDDRPTIFMRSSQPGGKLTGYHLESGETVADGEDYAQVEGESGVAFITRMEIDPALVAGMRLAAHAEFSANILLMLCDEVVVNRDDVGPGSLRQAVADVRDGGSVCFDPAHFDNGIPVTLLSEIVVDKSVHICGTGIFGTVVEATQGERIFDIAGGTQSSLIDVTLRGGSQPAGGDGGLVYNAGVLTLDGAQLHSGNAERGGAVFNVRGGDPDNPPGPNDGTLWLRETSITYNEAARGGGIYNAGGTVYAVDSRIQHNHAEQGGGVYGDAASFSVRDETMVVHNTALEGGGFYLHSPGAISGLNEVDGGAIHANAAERGGGVYMDGGRLRLQRNLSGIGLPEAVSGNLAEHGGGVFVSGGFLELYSNAQVARNTARQDGGGVVNDRGSVSPGANGIVGNLPNDLVHW